MEVLQNIKNRTTIQSSNSTSGYLSKENKNTNSKRHMHANVHCSIIFAKTWKQPKCPSIHEWVKMWRIYIRTQWNISHKKEWNLPFATTLMDLEGITLCVIDFLIWIGSCAAGKWENGVGMRQKSFWLVCNFPQLVNVLKWPGASFLTINEKP